MEPSESLALWLGPLLPAPQLTVEPDESTFPQCTLYLGAGFTKATNGEAPLFGAYLKNVQSALQALPTFPAALRTSVMDKEKVTAAQITELAELYHNYAGRRRVAELFLSEPVGDMPALAQGKYQDWLHPLPPRAEATYRTLEHWQDVITRHHPLHLSVLDPAGPPHLLGRMLLEGWIQQVLSTNWDCYVELGAWLTGLEIQRMDQPSTSARKRRGRQALQIFNRGRNVSLHTRSARLPLLLKLHSGVEVVAELLSAVAKGELTQAQVERALKECFLVSSTDLTHWRDAAQWVQDVVSDILRSSRVAFIGVSGLDTVTFRAVRARVLEWEQAAQQREEEQSHRTRLSRAPEPGPLPLTLFAREKGDVRHACMLSVQPPRGGPTLQIATVDGRKALQFAYAWSLLKGVLSYLNLKDPTHAKLARVLEHRLTTELNKEDGERPLFSLLCSALGPNARWAALAEGRPPFQSLPLEGASRWWYAPWFMERSGQESVSSAAMLQVAACLGWLSHPHEQEKNAPRKVGSSALVGLMVDDWTGVVALPWWKPLIENEELKKLLIHRDLLLIPWPWKTRNGVMDRSLHWGLKHTLHWNPGRSRSWLASPRLSVLPVGDPTDGLLKVPMLGTTRQTAQANALRRELPLSAGFARLEDPIDWVALFTSL